MADDAPKARPPRVATFRRDKDGWYVGAKSQDSDYVGPTAHVYAERGWLFVNTDDYEGCAMLNIEALPALRRALAQLAKQLKADAQ